MRFATLVITTVHLLPMEKKVNGGAVKPSLAPSPDETTFAIVEAVTAEPNYDELYRDHQRIFVANDPIVRDVEQFAARPLSNWAVIVYQSFVEYYDMDTDKHRFSSTLLPDGRTQSKHIFTLFLPDLGRCSMGQPIRHQQVAISYVDRDPERSYIGYFWAAITVFRQTLTVYWVMAVLRPCSYVDAYVQLMLYHSTKTFRHSGIAKRAKVRTDGRETTATVFCGDESEDRTITQNAIEK